MAGPGSGGPTASGLWPSAVTPVFARSITVEYTSVSRAGLPVMVPVTPYLEDGQRTLDVSTGLTYPAKAERARRNPKVALLFSDAVGSGLSDPPVVLVQGLATVRDAELQANTERYVRLAMAKLPDVYQGQPTFVLRKLSAYFARIWICVTPMRIWWWPSKALDSEPERWAALPGVEAPPSDPAPAGKQPPAWLEPPPDWRAVARDVTVRLEQRDLAWVGRDGFPIAVPISGLDQVEDGFRLALGAHAPGSPEGPATLTMHSHPAAFTGQENHTFVGAVHRNGTEYEFRVERLLADVSLTGNRLVSTVGFLRKVRRLHKRMQSEATRRGQPVPEVRFPDEMSPVHEAGRRSADYSVWIHAQPEDVWRVYVDPARIPDWQAGSPVIKDISGGGDEPGTTYVSRRGPGVARTTVLEAIRPRRLVTRTQAYLGLEFDVISELTSDGEGTLLELRARTEWPRGRALLGKLIEMVILTPAEARKELSRLKALVEQG